MYMYMYNFQPLGPSYYTKIECGRKESHNQCMEVDAFTKYDPGAEVLLHSGHLYIADVCGATVNMAIIYSS